MEEKPRQFSDTEVEKARIGFEKLAIRLDELWTKDEPLTPEENREVELILNNAMVIEEALRGEVPQEFGKEEAA